ncbi:hypothetical protein EDB81DRAFT_898383 [Dactylonectria macrodidyma]|uniref:Uncharacterized protein n=1 Tax=Dactylonectria macrodidyma TaxID=307937 RepID=A0A9P9FX16_9HYPO|nr:hypothetical protein EDB81DRAFT_898383 [Dactylonectria macrodidyma]
MDSTAASGSTSPVDTEPPKKPSLGTSHDRSLLLGIGTGGVENELIDQMELEPGDEDLDHLDLDAETGALDQGYGVGSSSESQQRYLSSRLPATFSHASGSNTSATGPSYSLPTDDPPLVRIHPVPQASALSGSQVAHSATNFEGHLLLPRHFEFSWESSQLNFAGEPFEVVRVTDAPPSNASANSSIASTTLPVSHPSSESRRIDGNGTQNTLDPTVLIGISGQLRPLATRSLGQYCERVSASCSISSAESSPNSMLSDDPTTSCPEPILAALARERIIDELFDVLYDDYMRSYAPDTSRKRNATVSGNLDSSSRGSDTKRIETNNSTRKRRDTYGSRNGDGEDPDDNGQGSSSTSQSERLLACPLCKWNPFLHRCNDTMRDIWQVKKHIYKKHQTPHCSTCYVIGLSLSNHDCRSNGVIPPDLVTAQKLEDMGRYSGRTTSVTEQWQHIYKAILPSEPLCTDPFVCPEEIELRRKLEEYLRSDQARQQVQRVTNEGIFGAMTNQEYHAVILHTVMNRLIPRIMSDLYSWSEDVSASPWLGDLPLDDGQINQATSQERSLGFDDSETISPENISGTPIFHSSAAPLNMASPGHITPSESEHQGLIQPELDVGNVPQDFPDFLDYENMSFLRDSK